MISEVNISAKEQLQRYRCFKAVGLGIDINFSSQACDSTQLRSIPFSIDSYGYTVYMY